MKITLLAVCLLLSAALLFGCGKTVSPHTQSAVTPEPELKPDLDPEAVMAKGEELFTLVDSEEEAKYIAELYGIDLVSFSNGVATFHSEEPAAVIEKGKANGWPLLEINHLGGSF